MAVMDDAVILRAEISSVVKYLGEPWILGS